MLQHLPQGQPSAKTILPGKQQKYSLNVEKSTILVDSPLGRWQFKCHKSLVLPACSTTTGSNGGNDAHDEEESDMTSSSSSG